MVWIYYKEKRKKIYHKAILCKTIFNPFRNSWTYLQLRGTVLRETTTAYGPASRVLCKRYLIGKGRDVGGTLFNCHWWIQDKDGFDKKRKIVCQCLWSKSKTRCNVVLMKWGGITIKWFNDQRI